MSESIIGIRHIIRRLEYNRDIREITLRASRIHAFKYTPLVRPRRSEGRICISDAALVSCAMGFGAPVGLLSQSSRGRVDVYIETFPYFLLARV